MSEEKFEQLLSELDKESQYFHDTTCSATYHTNGGALHDLITFRDTDTGAKMVFNISDAVYIFDSFFDIGIDEVIDFFNNFIEYRNLKIVKIDDK